MKVMFVNRFFFPDESATSQLLSDLAFHLAQRGVEVHVVTSRLDRVEPSRRYRAREQICGVTVHRVWSSGIGRNKLIGRSIDYLTFYLGALAALVRHLSRGAVLVAKTDPPLIGVVAALACRVRGARLVNWLQDLFPEVAAAAGVVFARGALGGVVKRARDWSLRIASANVAIGEEMGRYLAPVDSVSRPLAVIHNWADGDAVRPMPEGASPLRREWGLEGRVVFMYSGNLGRVHDYQTLLDLATELRGDANVAFLFVGQGHGLSRLREEAARRGLTNLAFKPLQPRDRLGALLAVGDVHIVTLAPGMGQFVLPSKLYGVLAAGRPVIFVGGEDSEVASIVAGQGCGFAACSGEIEKLTAIIRQLAGDAQMRQRLGANARLTFEQRFAKPGALEAWQQTIETAARP
jgi:glycosyltransferase involved in cell wall biosynthesis